MMKVLKHPGFWVGLVVIGLTHFFCLQTLDHGISYAEFIKDQAQQTTEILKGDSSKIYTEVKTEIGPQEAKENITGHLITYDIVAFFFLLVAYWESRYNVVAKWLPTIALTISGIGMRSQLGLVDPYRPESTYGMEALGQITFAIGGAAVAIPFFRRMFEDRKMKVSRFLNRVKLERLFIVIGGSIAILSILSRTTHLANRTPIEPAKFILFIGLGMVVYNSSAKLKGLMNHFQLTLKGKRLRKVLFNVIGLFILCVAMILLTGLSDKGVILIVGIAIWLIYASLGGLKGTAITGVLVFLTLVGLKWGGPETDNPRLRVWKHPDSAFFIQNNGGPQTADSRDYAHNLWGLGAGGPTGRGTALFSLDESTKLTKKKSIRGQESLKKACNAYQDELSSISCGYRIDGNPGMTTKGMNLLKSLLGKETKKRDGKRTYLNELCEPDKNPFQETSAITCNVPIDKYYNCDVSGEKSDKGKRNVSCIRVTHAQYFHNDRAITTVNEVNGHLLGLGLIALYGFLILQMIKVFRGGRSRPLNIPGIALGIIGLWVGQVFVHIGGNMGITPFTGVVLPLISHGGTAQMLFWLSIGLLIAAQTQSVPSTPDKDRIGSGLQTGMVMSLLALGVAQAHIYQDSKENSLREAVEIGYNRGFVRMFNPRLEELFRLVPDKQFTYADGEVIKDPQLLARLGASDLSFIQYKSRTETPKKLYLGKCIEDIGPKESWELWQKNSEEVLAFLIEEKENYFNENNAKHFKLNEEKLRTIDKLKQEYDPIEQVYGMDQVVDGDVNMVTLNNPDEDPDFLDKPNCRYFPSASTFNSYNKDGLFYYETDNIHEQCLDYNGESLSNNHCFTLGKFETFVDGEKKRAKLRSVVYDRVVNFDANVDLMAAIRGNREMKSALKTTLVGKVKSSQIQTNIDEGLNKTVTGVLEAFLNLPIQDIDRIKGKSKRKTRILRNAAKKQNKLAKDRQHAPAAMALIIDAQSGEILVDAQYKRPAVTSNEEEAPLYRQNDDLSRVRMVPGSVFKIYTALADAHRKHDDELGESMVFQSYSKGYQEQAWNRDEYFIKDSGRSSRGRIGLKKALQKSSNQYFAQLATQVDTEAFSALSSILPWSNGGPHGEINIDKLNRDGRLGLAMSGYGQDAVEMNMYQVALMMQAATQGKVCDIDASSDDAFTRRSPFGVIGAGCQQKTIDLNPNIQREILFGLKAATERQGTARGAKFYKSEELTVIGKTGTAQVPFYKTDLKEKLRYGNGQTPFASKETCDQRIKERENKGDNNAQWYRCIGKNNKWDIYENLELKFGVHEDKNGECKLPKKGNDVCSNSWFVSFATAKTDELKVGSKGIITVVMIPRGGKSSNAAKLTKQILESLDDDFKQKYIFQSDAESVEGLETERSQGAENSPNPNP